MEVDLEEEDFFGEDFFLEGDDLDEAGEELLSGRLVLSSKGPRFGFPLDVNETTGFLTISS